MINDDAPTIIKGLLNCSRINKNRLFTKEGKEGKYLKIVLIKKKARDNYGRVAYMIKEDITKDERAAGVEGNFIGDGYIQEAKGTAPAPAPAAPAPPKRKDGKLPY